MIGEQAERSLELSMIMLSFSFLLLGSVKAVPTKALEPRTGNGLALTPPMG